MDATTDDSGASLAVEGSADIGRQAGDPAARLIADEMAATCEAAVSSLPPRQQAIIQLCIFEGLSAAQAASRLTPPITADSARHLRRRACESLRAVLENDRAVDPHRPTAVEEITELLNSGRIRTIRGMAQPERRGELSSSHYDAAPEDDKFQPIRKHTKKPRPPGGRHGTLWPYEIVKLTGKETPYDQAIELALMELEYRWHEDGTLVVPRNGENGRRARAPDQAASWAERCPLEPEHIQYLSQKLTAQLGALLSKHVPQWRQYSHRAEVETIQQALKCLERLTDAGEFTLD